MTVTKKKEVGLLTSLEEDDKLDKETKLEYISMAKIYLEDFKHNINKTSIDMNDVVPLSIDVWKNFLEYPIVRKYIQSFKDERIDKIADNSLMQGDKGALNIKKALKENGPINNNSNIILVRVPERIEYD